MSALTVHLPDDKHQRLRAMAESRGTTLNRLIDDMATVGGVGDRGRDAHY